MKYGRYNFRPFVVTTRLLSEPLMAACEWQNCKNIKITQISTNCASLSGHCSDQNARGETHGCWFFDVFLKMNSKTLNGKSSVDIAFPEVRFGPPESAPRGAHLGYFLIFCISGRGPVDFLLIVLLRPFFILGCIYMYWWGQHFWIWSLHCC